MARGLPYELFLGWRYLYQRRRSWVALAAMAVCFAGLVFGQVALFAFSWVKLGAILTVPCALGFIFALVMHFFSLFTTVSIISVTLGVSALTVVLSVTSGFQASFKQKVLGVNAHVLVLKYGRDFGEYRDVMKTAKEDPRVVAVAPFSFDEMMLSSGRGTSGALVKGIDPRAAGAVLDIAEKLEAGKLSDLEAPRDDKDTARPMLIGRELAKALKVKVGDRLRLVVPASDLGGESAGQTASRDFKVAGIFYAGFDEYDRHLAYIALGDAQALLGGQDYVTGVEMRVTDLDAAPAIARALLEKLGGTPFRVIDWQELNHNLFTAVRTQKLVIVICLTIIIIVASFTIIASLTMLVVDKTQEIAILKSMGLSAAGTARVFLAAGLGIGALGVTFGLGLGLFLCMIVKRFGYALDPHVYLIDQLPVDVSVAELALTVGMTMLICLLVTILPAVKAASLEPVEGLRHE